MAQSVVTNTEVDKFIEELKEQSMDNTRAEAGRLVAQGFIRDEDSIQGLQGTFAYFEGSVDQFDTQWKARDKVFGFAKYVCFVGLLVFSLGLALVSVF